MVADIIPFPSKPHGILRIIQSLSKDSSRLRIGPAAKGQFDSRAITFRQVLNCLKNGTFSDGPHHDEHGCICCELTSSTAGQFIRVVVSIEGKTPADRVLHILFAEEM